MIIQRIRAEAARLLALVPAGERLPLIGWGSAAGAALVIAGVAALAGPADGGAIDGMTVAAIETAPALPRETSIDAATVTALEARNAQLLGAVSAVSDDNEALRSRLALIERKLGALAALSDLSSRLTRIESDVTALSRTTPFDRGATNAPSKPVLPPIAESAPTPAPTLPTIQPMPPPLSAAPPPAPQAAVTAPQAAPVAATPGPVATIEVPRTKLADRLLPAATPTPPVAPIVSSVAPTHLPPETDPILTGSIAATAAVDDDEDANAGDGAIMPSAAETMIPLAPMGTDDPRSDRPIRARNGASLGAIPVPAPRPQTVTRTEFGVDLGAFASVAVLQSKWRVLAKKNPALTRRLNPMVATRSGLTGPETHLVAGPFADAADAAVACAKFKSIGAACRTAQYAGDRPLDQ